MQARIAIVNGQLQVRLNGTIGNEAIRNMKGVCLVVTQKEPTPAMSKGIAFSVKRRGK
jgi:hypothetical protein